MEKERLLNSKGVGTTTFFSKWGGGGGTPFDEFHMKGQRSEKGKGKTADHEKVKKRARRKMNGRQNRKITCKIEL